MYWALVGFGALFPLGGSALLYAAYDWQQRVKRSFSWPTAQGRVLKSEVVLTRRVGVNSRINYVPNVEYEYTVDDVLYTHDHIELGGNTSDPFRGSAEKRAPSEPARRRPDVPRSTPQRNRFWACLRTFS